METLQENQQPLEGFHITDENGALWYLRKLANIEAETRRVKKQAAALLASLNSDAESLKRVYEGELEHWTQQELAKGGNRKRTLHTLQGTLRFRNLPSRLAIEEDANALRFATESLLDCVVTKTELNRPAYLEEAHKRLKETGELLPGVGRIPERETFSVSFANPEEN